MVGSRGAKYSRSVSFPIPKPSNPSSSSSSFNHTRSTSLPISPSHHHHPLIPKHLIDHINDVSAISSTHNNNNNNLNHDYQLISSNPSSWIADVLVKLKLIHDSLEDLLRLPQSKESIACCHEDDDFLEKLLDDSLVFVDAYGILRTSLLDLKQELSLAQVAIRTRDRDDAQLAHYLKAQFKFSKEITKLGSTLLHRPTISSTTTSSSDDELSVVITQVHTLTSSVSAAIFDAIAASFSPGPRKGSSSSSWMTTMGSFKGAGVLLKRIDEGNDHPVFWHGIGVESAWGLRKSGSGGGDGEVRRRRGLVRKMREVEDWVCDVECKCGIVFRSLIKTRVSLLNIVTN